MKIFYDFKMCLSLFILTNMVNKSKRGKTKSGSLLILGLASNLFPSFALRNISPPAFKGRIDVESIFKTRTEVDNGASHGNE